jgi:hypothetical protein
MKLSPLAQAKIAAVLAMASVLLGCEAPVTSAGEQTPPVYPALTTGPRPDLVTALPQAAPSQTSAPPSAAAPQTAAEAPVQGDGPGEETPTRPVTLSERLQEVVKLAQSGVGDEVILAFIENSPAPFNPSPDEILYLTDLGISDVIVTALVNHHATQAQVAQQVAPAAVPGPVGQPEQPPSPDATYNPEPPMGYETPPVEYATPPPAEYDYFYSSLTPYGSWVEVPDYGYCWQPTVAVVHSGWRPYCDRGRWLFTDSGWYWQSDYSWGWAPFHYGRWFNHPNRGWCWRPDRVWGPAWVSWRYTDSHCGWAPLPPGARYHSGVGFTYYGAHVGASFGFGLHGDAWTFVPAHRFHEHEVWRYRVASSEHVNVYRHSRVINNYVAQNNTIVNRGVPPERVPALARAEVRKVAIRDLPDRGSGGVRPDRLHQEGNQLVVYRPKPPVLDQRSVGDRPATGATRGPEVRTGTGVTPAPGVTARPGIVERDGRNAPTAANSSSDLLARTRPQPERPQETHTPGVASGSERRPITSPGANPSGEPVSRPNRPSTPLDSPGTGNRVVPQPGRPVAPSTPFRVEPSRSATTIPSAAPTQGSRPMPQVSAPGSTTPAPQTYRAPAPASSPGTQVRPSSPTLTPSNPGFRQEPARVNPQPRVESAPITRNRSTPSFTPAQPSAPAAQSRPVPSYTRPETRALPSYTPPAAQSRPAPSYSAPMVQPRPAPSYTPPAAQSRPAPSYSAPAVQSRPSAPPPTVSAPPARPAPAPVQSSNKREK